MSEGKGDGGGFKVTDRRRFAEEPDTDATQKPSPSDAERVFPSESVHAPVTFLSFIMGLGTQALMHLGEIADPATGEPSADLDAASHLIDILAILQVKTTGNLTQDEAGFIEAVLYDLRMRYVELRKGPSADPGKETS